MRLAAICVAFSLSLPAATGAAGDIVAGKAVFAKCSACHSLDQPKNRVGPHLMGILERPAASVADYTKYSAGMKTASAAGLVWDEKSLTDYLAAPKTMVPGTKMMFSGLKTPVDIANLIAYLATAPAN